MTTTWMLWCVAANLAVAGDVASGPAVGEKPAALPALVVVGNDEGKERDLATERGLQPTVFVFIPADRFSRPMARFLKTLDEKISGGGENARVVAVWLSDDRQATQDYLPKAQMSLKFARTSLSLAAGGKAGPDGWGLNGDAHLTAVVVAEGKVKASLGYVSVNETVVPEVIEALK